MKQNEYIKPAKLMFLAFCGLILLNNPVLKLVRGANNGALWPPYLHIYLILVWLLLLGLTALVLYKKI